MITLKLTNPGGHIECYPSICMDGRAVARAMLRIGRLCKFLDKCRTKWIWEWETRGTTMIVLSSYLLPLPCCAVSQKSSVKFFKMDQTRFFGCKPIMWQRALANEIYFFDETNELLYASHFSLNPIRNGHYIRASIQAFSKSSSFALSHWVYWFCKGL